MLPPPGELGYQIGGVIGWVLGNITLPILCCGILPAVAIFGVSYALYANIKQRRAQRATEYVPDEEPEQG